MSNQPKQLFRSRTNRMIAGVAGGLAEYFNIDPTLVRLALVFGVFFLGIPGAMILVYLVLAIVVPEAPQPGQDILDGAPVNRPPEAESGRDDPIDPAI